MNKAKYRYIWKLCIFGLFIIQNIVIAIIFINSYFNNGFTLITIESEIILSVLTVLLSGLLIFSFISCRYCFKWEKDIKENTRINSLKSYWTLLTFCFTFLWNGLFMGSIIIPIYINGGFVIISTNSFNELLVEIVVFSLFLILSVIGLFLLIKWKKEGKL